MATIAADRISTEHPDNQGYVSSFKAEKLKGAAPAPHGFQGAKEFKLPGSKATRNLHSKGTGNHPWEGLGAVLPQESQNGLGCEGH